MRLEPDADLRLDTWLTAQKTGSPSTQEAPLMLCIGPEGGFSEIERAVFAEHGTVEVRLAPHVLRIETAALAAMAVVACALG